MKTVLQNNEEEIETRQEGEENSQTKTVGGT